MIDKKKTTKTNLVFLAVLSVLLLFTYWVSGCSAIARHNRSVMRQQIQRDLTCFKHKRSGLCFCSTDPRWPVVVPCGDIK